MSTKFNDFSCFLALIIFSSRFYSIMFPLLRKERAFRLYPKKLNYLFLAVFAFFSPFCYAKTAFSYSPDILSPCTPDVTMVKNVVKSVSEKMICGHHFEVKNALENDSVDREKTHRKQRRNIPTTACGRIDKQQFQLCGQRGANNMVKLCGRRREQRLIPSSAGVVL